MGAGQEAGAYRQAALIEGVHVREAMITDVRTLSVGNTLKEAADILLDTSQHDFPVVHGDAVQGLLTRNDLLRALAEQGPGGYVAGAMNRRFVAAGPDDDLGEALPRLQATPGPLLVLDGDRLLGIVTGENVAEFFAIRQIAAARNGGQADCPDAGTYKPCPPCPPQGTSARPEASPPRSLAPCRARRPGDGG